MGGGGNGDTAHVRALPLIAAALLLIYLDRRFRLGHGRVFWLYVFVYTLGRVWIEALRIDEAELVLGLRLNVWTSIVVGIGALVAFIVVGRRHPGREESVSLGASPEETTTTVSEDPVDESARR